MVLSRQSGVGTTADGSRLGTTASVAAPSGSPAANGFTVEPAGPTTLRVAFDNPSGVDAVSCCDVLALQLKDGIG